MLDIYDALHTVGGIDHVLVRHEQAAVHMADGSARATGDVGVVLVTSTGSDQCDYRDCYGLYGFHSAGDSFRPVATSLIGYDAFQECDMVGISTGGQT